MRISRNSSVSPGSSTGGRSSLRPATTSRIRVDSEHGEPGLRQAGRDHHAEVPEPNHRDRGVLLSGHRRHPIVRRRGETRPPAVTLCRMESSEHARGYFDAVGEIAAAIDAGQVDAMARGLAAVRERGGRLFILGVGGGAGHASHAVNDFRKLCRIESYAPTDNVSELTARTNDDGWDTSFTDVAGGLAARRRRRAARLLRRRRLARAQRLGQPRQRDRARPGARRGRSTASSARRAARWPSSPTWPS